MRNKRFPKYPDDTDYNTNSPSYYDDLARKQKLIQLLAEKIWEYDKTLHDSLEEVERVLAEVVDKIGEGFNEEIYDLLTIWVEDGTLDHIINETLMNKKADIQWVEEQLNLKADKKHLEEELINIINEVNHLLNEQEIKVDNQLHEQEIKVDNQLHEQEIKVNNQLKENNERVKDLENFLRTDEMVNEIWSWWMYPQAIYKNNMTFFGSINNKGEVSVHSFNHLTREHQRTVLFESSIDDHNSTSVNILDNGRIIVFYCRHNSDSIIRYRVSDSPFDITSFGSEKTHSMNSNITYMQSYIDETGRIHLFTRRQNSGWYYLQSIDNGNSWKIQRTLIITDSGQFYLKIKPRKSSDNVEQIRMVFTGHPDNSVYQDIYYCYMDLATGQIIIPNAEIIGTVYTGEGVVFSIEDLLVAYQTPSNKRTRLFDVSDKQLNILFCEFEKNNEGLYKYLRWNSTAQRFDIIDMIKTGSVIGGGVERNYYGGGVLVENEEDTIILSREDEGIWYIEKWKYIRGKWEVNIISESVIKQFRPIVPRNNSDNVMFIKGNYDDNNFTIYNTDIVYLHNIQSDIKANEHYNKYSLTGFTSFRNSEVLVYGNGEYMEQKGLGFVRVPLQDMNDTWRGNLQVNFDKPFKYPPEVFLQGHNYTFNIAVSNITEDGFEINALRVFGDKQPEDVAVRWHAKGR